MGVLTKDEGEFMIDFEKDVLDLVNVDDFPLEHFGEVSIKYDEPKPAKKTRKKKAEA